MNHRAGIVLALLGCMGLVHASEPLLSIGPEIPVFLSAAASVRYDDNIFFSKTNKDSDTVYVLMPGVNFHTGTGAGKAGISFSEQFIRYSSHSSLNSELASLAANAGYDGGVSRVDATASYQELDQSNTSLRNRDQTVRQNVTSVILDWNGQLAGKTSLGTGFGYDRTTYPKAGYTDNAAWSLPVDVYYALSGKTDLSLGYRYRRWTSEGDVNNSKDNFFNVGARGQFTPKFSGQIRTGLTQRRQDKGGTDRLLGLGANFDYAVTPKSKLSLDASNDYNNSAFGVSQRVLRTGLTAEVTLSTRWTVSQGVSYERTHYLGDQKRTDNFWVGSLGVSYALTSNAFLQASYVFRKNTSNVPVEFQGSVLSLSASISF